MSKQHHEDYATERRCTKTAVEYRATCPKCPDFRGKWTTLNLAQLEARTHRCQEVSK